MRPACLAALALLSCRTAAPTPQSVLDALAAQPAAHLTGSVSGLGPPVVLNAEDFVYDAKLSPDAKTAAVSRLGPKSFHLALHTLGGEKPEKRADPAVTPLEFDVDAVEFSPDGALVATVCRDGALRVYAAQDGALAAAWLTEEPLVSVAWGPRGDVLAVGSARGLVTLLAWPGLGFLGERRLHQDEVRGLAWGKGGVLVSAGWDKRLVVSRVEPPSTPPRTARLAMGKKNGVVLFRALLDGQALGQVTVDNRLPGVVVRAALAEAAGIPVSQLTESTSVSTGLGVQVARVAKGRRLAFKTLILDGVDVAVCDACVPPEAQGVLGASLLNLVDVAFDDADKAVLVTAKAGATVTQGEARELVVDREYLFPAALNDLSIDAAGEVLGVAFSETKSERTREVYEREKRKEVEPERPWDCGARVELATGKVLEKRSGHHGVVATAGISPDGKTLATGGWDKTVRLHLTSAAEAWIDDDYGWAVRRVRFSRDGRWLITAAWTPLNPLGDHQSDPSAVVYEVRYSSADVAPSSR
ncbi:MAG: aspartyl protease family protein [Myxococcota bacterium]